MANVKLGNKTFEGVTTVKLNTVDGGTVEFIETGGGTQDEWIGDGNTHLWVTLHEGRTSPRVGVAVNGTVTVDWGDGTEPDVLTGTSTNNFVCTPVHEYDKAGEYIISLSVDGEMRISQQNQIYVLCAASGGNNYAYKNAIKRAEIGRNTNLGSKAFYTCYSLSGVYMPAGITIDTSAFYDCHSLASISIPDGFTHISDQMFTNCTALSNVSIPDSVTTIGNSAFYGCTALSNIHIPNSVTTFGSSVFQNCTALSSISIPDGVTNIGGSMFNKCLSLSSLFIHSGVTNIGNSAFQYCHGMKFYDFTTHTAVPTLGNSTVFNSIPADCEIRVPAALVDEWKAATNWATYADYIVGV